MKEKFGRGLLLDFHGQGEFKDAICRGTLLSRAQYLVDVNEWGYKDVRLEPRVAMSEDDIAHWTRAIDEIP